MSFRESPAVRGRVDVVFDTSYHAEHRLLHAFLVNRPFLREI